MTPRWPTCAHAHCRQPGRTAVIATGDGSWILKAGSWAADAVYCQAHAEEECGRRIVLAASSALGWMEVAGALPADTMP